MQSHTHGGRDAFENTAFAQFIVTDDARALRIGAGGGKGGNAGIAAVIDPRPDVEVYLKRARAQSVRITHVREMHIHPDSVSGFRVQHREWLWRDSVVLLVLTPDRAASS